MSHNETGITNQLAKGPSLPSADGSIAQARKDFLDELWAMLGPHLPWESKTFEDAIREHVVIDRALDALILLCQSEAQQEIERLKLQLSVAESSNREYEQDCAILPEDRSVTDYVRMLYRKFADICEIGGAATPTEDENGDSQEWQAVNLAIAAASNLKARAEAAEASLVAQGWQPIETAPKDGTQVVLLLEGHTEAVVASWREVEDFALWVAVDEFKEPSSWDGGSCWEHSDQPTHWAPLPAITPASPAPSSDQVERKGY